MSLVAHQGVEPDGGRGLTGGHGVEDEGRHRKIVVSDSALNGRWPDVTLNVGVVRSGRRANVVPADAEVVRLLASAGVRTERVPVPADSVTKVRLFVAAPGAGPQRSPLTISAKFDASGAEAGRSEADSVVANFERAKPVEEGEE